MAYAGLRGPGKYCGVAVFDRWDTCFLLSGPYITYISDNVKNELRPYAGKAMQVDASSVFQPQNPGDALIREYKVIGPAPVIDHPPSLDSLELIAQSDFSIIGAPAFRLEIRNTGNKPVEVFSAEIGPAMLGKNSDTVRGPSDGSSVAWITRVDLALLSSEKSEWNKLGYSLYYADSREVLPKRFFLQPSQSGKTRIAFKLPSGQYQFIVGYGGGVHAGKSVASNAVSFDVNDDGLATLATSVSTTECLYVYAGASRCVLSLQK